MPKLKHFQSTNLKTLMSTNTSLINIGLTHTHTQKMLIFNIFVTDHYFPQTQN